MSTKRQRLAQQTQGGEPTLSLLDFRAAAARTEVDAAAASHAGACATLEECYLAYCYLCRTGAWRTAPDASSADRSCAARRVEASLRLLAGLWSEISPRLSPCGAFYLACEPSTIVSKRRRTEAPAGGAAVDAPVEAAAAAAAQVAPAAIADATAPEDLQATAADDEDDDDVLSSSGGEVRRALGAPRCNLSVCCAHCRRLTRAGRRGGAKHGRRCPGAATRSGGPVGFGSRSRRS